MDNSNFITLPLDKFNSNIALSPALTFSNLIISPSSNNNATCDFAGGISALDANDNIVIYGIPFNYSTVDRIQIYYFNPPTLYKGGYANYNILHPNNNFYGRVL